MTILVTGGAGFIANTLVDSILSRGDSVICLDNLCRGTIANVARFTEKNSFRFSAVDLADLDAFRSCLDSHADLGPDFGSLASRGQFRHSSGHRGPGRRFARYVHDDF